MINLLKKKISKKLVFSAIFLLLLLFFNVNYVKANIVTDLLYTAAEGGAKLATAPMFMVLGTVIVAISWLVGQISTLLVLLLGQVMGYNSFIAEPIVGYGWTMVRDICNMFFILILLIIAFATILRFESYSWKKNLPKLLIMAVLINFSKTICGLVIDFSQVMMLTFLNGINGGGDFLNGAMVNALGLQNVLTFKTANVDTIKSIFSSESNPMTVFGSILFGFILLVIACIVVAIYTIILIFRIVMLWILIILSPLAFLAMAIPAGAKYASQWTSEFFKHVIVGPVLIFFLWLALLLSQHAFSNNLNINPTNSFDSGILTKAADPANLANFVIVIIFLLAGLMMAQQIGASGGSIAGKGLDWAKKSAMAPLAGAKVLGGYGIDKLHEKTGVDLNAARVWTGIQEKRAELKKKRYGRGMIKASEMMREKGVFKGLVGMTGTPGQAWEQLTTGAGWKRRIMGGKRAKGKIDELAQLREDENEKIKKQTEEITSRRSYQKSQEILSNPSNYTEENVNNAKNIMQKLDEEIREKIQPFKEEIKNINDQILNYKPMVDFDAVSMQGALEAEEMKKVDHIKDREELASMLRDAMKSGDKTRFSAIALKLTKDGNENDGVLNNLGFSSNAEGLKGMIASISNKEINGVKSKNYMDFSDQEAKALGMKISYAAEANNHWGTARAFTMEDGRYRDSTSKEQAMAAVSEIAKMDPQQIALKLNRLGYGGERPDGTFDLNEFGLALLKTVGPKVADHMNRFNPNAAARLSTPENIELMVDVGVAPEFITGLQAKGKTKTITAGASIDQLEKSGYFKKT